MSTLPDKAKLSPVMSQLLDDDFKGIYIFGVSYLSYETALFMKDEGFKITGFVCDFNAGTDFKGFSVISREQFFELSSSVLILCALTSHLKIESAFKSMGFINYVSFYELARYFPALCDRISYFQGLKLDIVNNTEKYDWLTSRLADEHSKATLKELLNMRLNYAFDKTGPRCKSTSDQYFSSMITLGINECFVDAGGNQGETTRGFIQRVNGNYEAIYFFEPQTELSSNVAENIADDSRFFTCDKLLYSKKTTLSFSDEFGSGSRISEGESAGTAYQTTTLDDELRHKPTFIKIDVEGAELEVIAGAKKTISKYKPKLAICVYHLQSHFWQVPELVLSYREDYQVYLRHYSDGIFETVIYFV